jgi:hypothetical protein
LVCFRSCPPPAHAGKYFNPANRLQFKQKLSVRHVCNRGALPPHLPREELLINIEDKTCLCCGGLKAFLTAREAVPSDTNEALGSGEVKRGTR